MNAQLIYADHAATTALDPLALEAMLPWLSNAYGNASQPYAFSRAPRKALREARETIAACIGAQPDEIFFTSGGSESDNWAIKSTLMLHKNDAHTITSAFEHHAVLHACEALEHFQYPVTYLKPTQDGFILPATLESALTTKTKLVSIMFANNELGTIQPIKGLAKTAHVQGSLFHTDAVQAVGHIPINVKDLDVDLLSASAHKFNGPKGIGFFYIKKGVELPSLIHGGAQEFGKRAGTENVASIVGMATALKNNCDELENTVKHLRSLEEYFIELINASTIPYHLNGDKERLPGLLSLSFPGKDGEAILHRMDLMGISISTGSACDSVNTEISHVLKAINLNEELAKGTIRISLGKENTKEDVERIVACLSKILK